VSRLSRFFKFDEEAAIAKGSATAQGTDGDGTPSTRSEQDLSHAGVLRVFPPVPGSTRIVLIRHGQAECNVNRVVGGVKGCTGLSPLGRRQVADLADRLYESGELRDATTLYASVLPRAVETAERLRPVVGSGPGALGSIVQDCELCELHPGESDGMSWDEVVDQLGVPDWDRDPSVPIAPGGESWCRGPAPSRRVGGGRGSRRGDRGDHDLVPRRAARNLPPGLGAHRARVNDRVGVGPGRGPLDPSAFQRLLRDPVELSASTLIPIVIGIRRRSWRRVLYAATMPQPKTWGWGMFDTTGVANGTYTLQSVATESEGPTVTSPGIIVTVQN
jgi:hypothetical protein